MKHPQELRADTTRHHKDKKNIDQKVGQWNVHELYGVDSVPIRWSSQQNS